MSMIAAGRRSKFGPTKTLCKQSCTKIAAENKNNYHARSFVMTLGNLHDARRTTEIGLIGRVIQTLVSLCWCNFLV